MNRVTPSLEDVDLTSGRRRSPSPAVCCTGSERKRKGLLARGLESEEEEIAIGARGLRWFLRYWLWEEEEFCCEEEPMWSEVK